jgi:heptose I phosphotransferase
VTDASRDTFHVVPAHQPLVREVGLDAEAVFERDDIKPWRTLPDRENCVLDAEHGGRPARLHVKRFPATAKGTPAQDEVRGIELLQRAGIPTVPLVGWGRLADGRSFVVSLDLDGFRDAEKLVQGGLPFAEVLEPTADLAAKLHTAGLHHRDLYLCHFFAKVTQGGGLELALIDAARVKALPKWFATRWVVKDLAQFWYSTMKLPVIDEQRDAWLARYAEQRKLPALEQASLRSAIVKKSAWIARHDHRLNARQPTRNVSLPSAERGAT